MARRRDIEKLEPLATFAMKFASGLKVNCDHTGAGPGNGTDRKVIIATVLRRRGATGVHTSFWSIMTNLRKSGHQVELATCFDGSPVIYLPLFGVRRLIARISPAAGVWWHRFFHAWILRGVLKKRLANGGPAVIYAQCPVSASAAAAVRDPLRHKLVLAVHFNLSQADEWRDMGLIREDDWVWRSIIRLERRILSNVDRLLYTSDFMKRHLEQRYPAVAKIPSMTGMNFIDPPEKCDRPAAEDLRDLVAVGSLEPRKNQGFILQVLAAAKQMGHRYTLTIVGNGPDMKDLKADVDRFDLADQVWFVGEVEEISPFLFGHKVFVHAAIMESLGLAVIEALAHGLPVVAAPVGGIQEIFKDGLEGRYWPLDDTKTAAKILVETLDDEEALDRMTDAARRRFQETFSTASVYPKVEQFLVSGAADQQSMTRAELVTSNA